MLVKRSLCDTAPLKVTLASSSNTTRAAILRHNSYFYQSVIVLVLFFSHFFSLTSVRVVVVSTPSSRCLMDLCLTFVSWRNDHLSSLSLLFLNLDLESAKPFINTEHLQLILTSESWTQISEFRKQFKFKGCSYCFSFSVNLLIISIPKTWKYLYV